MSYLYTPVQGGIPNFFSAISNIVPLDINELADISVVKTINTSPVVAGEQAIYTIIVQNSGPSPASNVLLTDAVTLINQQYSLDNGVTWINWTGNINLGNIQSGGMKMVLIRGIINPLATGQISNTATVSSPTPDPNLNNNTSTVTAAIDTVADLSITKTAAPNPVIAGNFITYNLSVENLGPSNAVGVNIADSIPSTVLNPEFSIDNGVSYNPWLTPYSLGNLAVGTIRTILIRGTVNQSATGQISNTATVTAQTTDPNPTNNSSTVISNIGTSADIAIVKTASPSPVVAGAVITYTLLVENLGPSDGVGISIADNIPGTVLNPEFSIDNGITYNSWSSPYSIGNLVAGGTRTILIRGTVGSATTGQISNTATVSSQTPDPNLNNNTSTVRTDVGTSADLGVVKTASPNPVIAGNTITYTIVVENLGLSDALGVSLADSIPSTVLNPQFSIDNGATYNNWLSPYSVGNLAAGAIKTILIRGTVSSSVTGTISNTAVVSASTPDPNPNNNTSTATSSTGTSADLSIVKTANPSPVIAGSLITYTIVVQNLGLSDATGVSLADNVPNTILNSQFSVDNGVTYNSWVSPYNIGNLAAGTSKTILIRGGVASGATGTISNTAVVSAVTPDPNPNNNSSTVVTNVGTSADLSVVKTINSNTIIAGDVITYTIIVENLGLSDAVGVSLTDSVPSNLLNPEFSVNNGSSYNPWVSPYSIGNLVAGESRTILIRGTVSSAATGIIVNTAVVSAQTPDPNPSNNSSTVTTNITTSADLSVVKTATPNPVVAGSVITYNIVVKNLGLSDAVGVTLTDSIPGTVLNPEFSINNGVSYSPWISPYNIGGLGAGVSKTILIRGTVSPSVTGTITNTAVVSAQTPDPNPNNNSSTVTSNTGTSADLSIVKTGNPNPVIAGEVINYTIKIENLGLSDAVGVNLTDTIPPAILNPEFSINNGVSYNSWSSPYNVGSVAVGEIKTILIRGTVNSSATGILSNTAVVSAQTPDPNPNNNSSTVTTNISTSADLSILKIDSPDPVVAGEVINYNIKIENLGLSDAVGVTLTDSIPSSILNPEFSINNGVSYSPWISPYTVGAIVAGTSKTILIRGTVSSGVTGTITNTAVVSARTPDPNPNNNSSTANTTITTSADLSIVKTESPNPVVAGNMINYVLTVENLGPSDSLGVSLADSIPSSILNPEFSINSGSSYNSWVTPYNMGNLAAGEIKTILIRGTVDSSVIGTLTNTATISANTPDPNLNNNTSTVTTQTTAIADISVIKMDSPDPVVAGEIVNYTIKIENLGPSNAIGINLVDNIPSSILNSEFSIDNGSSYNPWISPYSIGNLAAGLVKNVLIRGKVSSAANGQITNISAVSASTPDPNLANNSSTAVTVVNSKADLSVIKTANPTSLNRGEFVTYTIKIENLGPSDAISSSLADNIATNIINPEFSIDNGVSYNPWVSPYNIGILTAGEIRTILIKGKISDSSIGITNNTATVSAQTPDPNPSNNSSTVGVNVIYADLLAPGNFIKEVDKSIVDLGEEITYTINVKNTGNTIANNVVIIDPVPNGTTYVGGSLIGTVAITGSPLTTISITNGIMPGQGISISYKVKVNSIPIPNPIPNTANIAYRYTSNPANPNGESESGNTNTVITEVRHGEVPPEGAVKSSDKGITTPGDIVTYTITAKNTGNVPVNDVVVKDALPVGTEFILSSVVINGVLKPNENPNMGIKVGNINPNETAIISFKIKVLESAVNPLTNKAKIQYSYIVNPSKPPVDKETPTNTVDVTVLKASLKLEKSADRTVAVVGDTIKYTIIATNNGEVLLENLSVKDLLNPSLQYGDNLTINGVPSNQSIVTGVNIGNLAVGESKIITFDTKVILVPVDKLSKNTSSANFTYKISGNTFGKTIKSNEVVVRIYTPDMVITKSSSFAAVKVGESFSYAINVRNTGDILLNNVLLKDEIPKAFKVIDVTINGTLVNGDINTGINIGNLAIGESKNITITLQVISDLVEVYKNVAKAIGKAIVDPTKPPAVIEKEGKDETGIEVFNPELTLIKSVDKPYVVVGDIVTYTIIAKNTGDVILGNVELDPVAVYDLLSYYLVH